MEEDKKQADEQKIDILPTYSIRRAKKTDVDTFLELTKSAETASEKFSMLVKMAVSGSEGTVDNSENEKLTEEIDSLKSQISALQDELEKQKAREPEVVEVPVKLSGAQFICTPADDVARAARKYRPFLIKKGHCTSGNFLNDLFNVSVKYYIEEKF